MRSRIISFALGLVLALGSLATLLYAYSPRSTRPPELQVSQPISIAAKCTSSPKLNLNVVFDNPGLLRSTHPVDFIIPSLKDCDRVSVIAAPEVGDVYLFSTASVSDAISLEEYKKRSTRRVRPTITDGNRDYVFDTKELAPHWSLMIKGAVQAERITFDSFKVSGFVYLNAGEWEITVLPSTEYQISGEGTVRKSVPATNNVDEFSASFAVTARFVRLEAFRQVFSIVLSTLLGIGIATCIEAAARLFGGTGAKEPAR
jgi:hypothetical protein